MAAENFKVKKGLEVGTGATITSGGVNVTGIITAVQFKGDGSGLTNVVGSGSGIVVKDEGSAVGTAGTINFVGTGVVAALSAGIATVTISSGGLTDVVDDATPELGGNLDLNNKFVTGSGGISVTGVVTATTFVGNGDFVDIDVDGQTELDDLNVAGVSTFGNNITASGTSRFEIASMENALLDGSISHTGDVTTQIEFETSTIKLDSAGTTRLKINNYGANITGGLNVTGVSTFIGSLQGSVGSFSGNVSGNQGTFSGNITGPLLSISPGSGDDGIILLNSAGGQNNDFSRIRQVVSDDSFRIENKSSGSYESLLTGIGGAGVKLYFAGNQKLETTGTGIAVPNISVSGVGTFSTRIDTNGVTLGTNNNTFAAKFIDDAVINVGTGNDLQISHVNDVSLIRDTRAGAGATLAIGADKLFLRNKDGNENYLEATDNGSVKLFYDFAPKFETDTAGVKITGVCTATSFSGDGSGLTGVTASGTGIVVKHDGSTVGTAGTINFSTNLDVSAISAGIVTVTASGGGGDKIEEGDTKVETIDSGDAADAYVTTEVNGTEEIRTIGGQTTIKYLRVGSGWNMANSTGNGIALNFSNNHDLISSSGTNGLDLRSNTSIELTQNGSPNYKYAEFRNTQGIFKTNNVERLRYAAGGIDVTGICTATSFSGSGIGLTSLNADNLGSGEIPSGRFPATLPAASGANLTSLNADNISSGTLASARIEDEAVTFAKMQHVGTGVIIGRNDAGSGDIETLTAAQVRTLINVEDGATAAGGSGISTVSGVVNIANNLDVDGHTELDNVNIVGVTTIRNASNTKLYEGAANGSKLFHAGGEKLSTELHGISINGTVVAKFVDLTSGGNPGIITARSFSGGGDGKFVTGRWDVVGGSVYAFTGPGGLSSSNQPKIYLARGQTYEFVISNASSHPFQIQQSNGSAYNTGVTNNGSNSNGVVVKFEVPFSAPNSLQYACTVHSGMGNTIIVYPDLSP